MTFKCILPSTSANECKFNPHEIYKLEDESWGEKIMAMYDFLHCIAVQRACIVSRSINTNDLVIQCIGANHARTLHNYNISVNRFNKN